MTPATDLTSVAKGMSRDAQATLWKLLEAMGVTKGKRTA